MGAKSFSLNINHRIKPFTKSIKVDSDKSLSIRSFLIGSICQDISVAKNVLESEDVLSTINCLKKLGVQIRKKSKSYFIHGKGLGSFFAKKNLDLNFGNSGTLARCILGLCSGIKEKIKLIGDKSLSKRDFSRVIRPLKLFGANCRSNNGKLPIKLIGSNLLRPIKYFEDKGSAQIKTCIILSVQIPYYITSILFM